MLLLTCWAVGIAAVKGGVNVVEDDKAVVVAWTGGATMSETLTGVLLEGIDFKVIFSVTLKEAVKGRSEHLSETASPVLLVVEVVVEELDSIVVVALVVVAVAVPFLVAEASSIRSNCRTFQMKVIVILFKETNGRKILSNMVKTLATESQ